MCRVQTEIHFNLFYENFKTILMIVYLFEITFVGL